MYHSIVGALMPAGTSRRARRDEGPERAAPSAIAALGDHHLRDIGFVRERVLAPRRHVLWM